LLLFTFSSLAYGTSQDGDKIILIGGDFNYPPYEFIDDSGKPSGYNVELTRAIAEVMGMNIAFRFDSWANVRTALERKELDALQGIVNSPQRRKLFSFSPPHAIVHQSIFARNNEPIASELAHLKGKDVVVQMGGIMHDYLLQNDVGAKIATVETHADALRQLAAGKHDYALVANLPGLYLGKELGLSNIVPVGKPFQAQQYGYAVNKGNDALLAQFSEGLAILINTGRQQQIYNKWLAPLQEQGLPFKKYAKIVAPFAALLLLVLGATMVWNRMLRRQVDKRTSELHIQQQQLIQADKMTSLGILISGVAHEINNPTGLLLLNLPIIREAWLDCQDILEQHYENHGDFILGGLAYSQMREEIPTLLTDMHDGAHRIKRIVNDLKDFSRQESEDLSELFNLNDIIATAIRLAENSISSSTDHFKVDYSLSLPLVEGNSQRIEQVIINLILNACQALDNRNSAISLRTFERRGLRQTCVQITDQGCGIQARNLTRLLDPFFTTRREQGGTGLGLSISSGIIQAHSGELKFESIPGEGTTVTLSLPSSEETHD
jgi:polar amino acid transport system substrate-binding protein